jgi:hypothetical protein
MLKNHWRAIIAFVGYLAISGILWVNLRPAPPSVPAYQHLLARNSTYYPGGVACRPTQSTARAGGRKSRIDSDFCKEASEQYRLQTGNLLQQTRIADASWASADLSYRQTAIALTSAIVGLFTLLAAVIAALYAKRAAEAAEQSIKHGLDTSRSELRAYLMSDSEAIFRDAENSRKFTGQITLKNTGATPATQMMVFLEKRFDYDNGGVLRRESDQYQVGTLSPGANSNLNIDVILDEDSERAFDQNKGKITFELRSPFRDSFGDEWVYHQDLSVNAESLAKQSMYTNDCGHTKQHKEERKAKRRSSPLLPMRLPFSSKKEHS